MSQASILQIASERVVFIFDLIKLQQEVPDILDDCLTRILQSPVILKLGMNKSNASCIFISSSKDKFSKLLMLNKDKSVYFVG